MSWPKITAALMSSVWGVIFLGALGSILAVAILKMLSPVWGWINRCLFRFLESRFYKFLRHPAETRGLAVRFIRHRDYFGFVTLAAMAVIDALFASLLLAGSLTLLGVYLIVRGLHASLTLACLVGCLCLSLYWWVWALLGFGGIYWETITPALKRVKQVLAERGPAGWSDFALRDVNKEPAPRAAENPPAGKN